MIDNIKLTLFSQLKIFISALFLIPIAVITHIVTVSFALLLIPNTVIDLITMAEKKHILHILKGS